jgi:hypothetical protein
MASIAAMLAFFPPSDTAGMMASNVSVEVHQAEAPAEPESRVAALSSYELGQCKDELAVYKESVDELVGIVEENCDAPTHDFERAALEIASLNRYSENHFNCVDFSDLLASKLRRIGYVARTVSGYYNGEPHAWVVMEVPIEATNGNLISPNSYAEYTIDGNAS